MKETYLKLADFFLQWSHLNWAPLQALATKLSKHTLGELKEALFASHQKLKVPQSNGYQFVPNWTRQNVTHTT